MVIADTSVWIEYFRGRHEPVRKALRALIQAEQAALVGVVLAELLQGCRTPKEANVILTKLTGLRFLETSFLIWKRTGELASSLRQKGITLPLSDLIIAAIALEHGCQVFALDPHFKKIPDLKLYPLPRSFRSNTG